NAMRRNWGRPERTPADHTREATPAAVSCQEAPSTCSAVDGDGADTPDRSADTPCRHPPPATAKPAAVPCRPPAPAPATGTGRPADGPARRCTGRACHHL